MDTAHIPVPPAIPRPPDAITRVYCLHAFHAENADELSFEAGGWVDVVEKDDEFGDGWWKGRRVGEKGEGGLFPASYVLAEGVDPGPWREMLGECEPRSEPRSEATTASDRAERPERPKGARISRAKREYLLRRAKREYQRRRQGFIERAVGRARIPVSSSASENFSAAGRDLRGPRDGRDTISEANRRRRPESPSQRPGVKRSKRESEPCERCESTSAQGITIPKPSWDGGESNVRGTMVEYRHVARRENRVAASGEFAHAARISSGDATIRRRMSNEPGRVS